MTQPSLIVDKIDLKKGIIGRLTLNQESTLNSLTLEMVDSLQRYLELWRDDDSVKLIFIDSTGDKAFCAGGDVQALYKSAIETPGGPCDYAETFFANEYRMNYTLHTYPKPIICWGQGIVMGGGLGVLAACSHRIVTETTRIAMPEITIALFPDVGGSWFLNKMPDNVGRFLALTGASINCTDAIYTGIADEIFFSESKPTFLESLCTQDWSDDNHSNHSLTTNTIQNFSENNSPPPSPGQIKSRLELIKELSTEEDIVSFVTAIANLETEDKWMIRARDGMINGSPFAACWIDHQLKITSDMTLDSVFQSEILLVTNIIRDREFSEGVRALLIDKDKNPNWQFPDVSSVPNDRLEKMFEPPWPNNPLADLGS